MRAPRLLLIFLFLFCCAAVRAAGMLGYDQVASVAVMGAGGALLSLLAACQPQREARFLRGRPRLRHAPSQAARDDVTPEALCGETILWGSEVLPAKSATTHFLVAGTTGAGKTLLLHRLMASVLPAIGQKRRDGSPFDRRALIYDAKGDMLAFLHTVAPCRLVTLHPFDARGAAWDMARDITTPAAALQAAALLIPLERSGSSNPFFSLAAQNLLRGVLLSFLQTVGENWTLRDVVLALRFEERLRQVLEKTLEGRAILDQFFGSGETLQGIRATIATKIAPLEVIAALWDTASEKVSLREFMAGEFILVLGNDEATRTALDAINRVLFQRLSELILCGSESRTRQTWLFLDEVREAGRLDGLSRLMTKGRSKGACVALGFQAIEGMREVYGNNVAEEITGLCNHKAILRLESPSSARWGSELFDKTEELERRESRSRSLQDRGGGLWGIGAASWGRSRTVSEQRVTTDAVLPSQIMTLPPAGPAQGLSGYFLSRERGAYPATLPWKSFPLPSGERAMEHAPEAARQRADFLPRPEISQYLQEWTPLDLERLGLKPLQLAAERESGVISSEDESYRQRPTRRVRMLRPVRGL